MNIKRDYIFLLDKEKRSLLLYADCMQIKNKHTAIVYNTICYTYTQQASQAKGHGFETRLPLN